MSVVINYKNNSLKSKIGNLIFFVDEKYKVSTLKKYLSEKELNCISDLLKSKDTKKKNTKF